MQPNETLFLESTSKVVKDSICNSAFVDFELWDLPGQIDFFDPSFEADVVFGVRGSLIFVIDAQVIHCPRVIVKLVELPLKIFPMFRMIT